MSLGMKIGLGPGDFVLDENPLPLPKRGGGGKIFDPCLWPNGWMEQDDTWHGRRPQSRRLYVRWGLSPPSQKTGGDPSPQFSALVYCGQTAAWIKTPLCTDVDPAVYAILC